MLITPVSGKNFESLSLEQWQFESYYLKYKQNWTAQLIISDPATSERNWPHHLEYHQ